VSARLQVIDDTVKAQPAVDALVKKWTDAAFDAFRKDGFAPEARVVTTTEPLDGRESTVRNREGRLTQIIANALQHEAAADVGIYNGGSVRIDDVLPPGPVTEYDIIRVLPFGGKVLRVEMDGALLSRVLDTGLGNQGLGGFLHSSDGMKRDSTGWSLNGARIDPARVYTVGVSDFLMTGGETNLGYLTRTTAGVHAIEEKRDVRRAVIDELKRIAEGYRSDYEIAKVREESIQKSMSEAVAQSQTASQAQLTLRDLESSAQTARALHDNFLQRYMEAVQQQSFPITEARSISPASRPLRKSHPRSTLILLMGTAGGILLGAGIAFLRDQLDRVFRSSGQVEEVLRLDCLSILPAISHEAPRGGRAKAVPHGGISYSGALSYVVKSPFSRFAESIRAIKVAIDLEASKAGKVTRVVGICSSLPNEGKSTVATNLAQLAAMSGARTLLLDCDLRNPSLSHVLAPDAKAGILELLAGTATLEQVMRRDPNTNLAFIPIMLKTRLANSSEILPSEPMKILFDALRQRFDYIIVDFPPLAPVVDVRATAHLVDSYLFVVEWGRTKIDVVQHALAQARGVYDQTMGVVLNKADMQVFSRYQGYTGNYYFNRHYGRYGYVD
jgi:capsular exopolysaccharide synthesis family protein